MIVNVSSWCKVIC